MPVDFFVYQEFAAGKNCSCAPSRIFIAFPAEAWRTGASARLPPELSQGSPSARNNPALGALELAGTNSYANQLGCSWPISSKKQKTSKTKRFQEPSLVSLQDSYKLAKLTQIDRILPKTRLFLSFLRWPIFLVESARQTDIVNIRLCTQVDRTPRRLCGRDHAARLDFASVLWHSKLIYGTLRVRPYP
jgi:hypothetical protein